MSQRFEMHSLVSSLTCVDRVLLPEDVATSLYDYFITLIASTQSWIKDGIRQNKSTCSRSSNHSHVVSYQIIVITFVTLVVVASYLIG